LYNPTLLSCITGTIVHVIAFKINDKNILASLEPITSFVFSIKVVSALGLLAQKLDKKSSKEYLNWYFEASG